MTTSNFNFVVCLAALLLVVLIVTADALASGKACHSPFGKLCGSVPTIQHFKTKGLGPMTPMHADVLAYSNCNGEFVSNSTHFVNLKTIFGPLSQHLCDVDDGACPTRIMTGLEWQCVELGRRWLAYSRGATFASVDYAVDIFALKNVTRFALEIRNNKCVCEPTQQEFVTIKNNRTDSVPRRGDLLIYSTEGPGMAPTGHVVVVLDVDTAAGKIRLAEQNWANAPWPHAGFSRTIALKTMIIGDKKVYSIQDPPYQVMGIKRVAEL